MFCHHKWALPGFPTTSHIGRGDWSWDIPATCTSIACRPHAMSALRSSTFIGTLWLRLLPFLLPFVWLEAGEGPFFMFIGPLRRRMCVMEHG